MDDTYEGAGEHDDLVIAVALAGWRVLPVACASAIGSASWSFFGHRARSRYL